MDRTQQDKREHDAGKRRDYARIAVSGQLPQPSVLPMSGEDAEGRRYHVDSQSLLIDGRRILPVMGEFHYSRYEPEDWALELRKMRAGGVGIVASYVFWLHHEEVEGEWDFSGCRDLRRFIETCRAVDMPLWLRIGPWAHGEARNGGFPDWLVERYGARCRTDDPGYLAEVQRFFARIGEAAHGLLLRDGGPIIGIQLENEYGHVGAAVAREDGYAHMRSLKRLANEAGLDAPWYTSTAWGGGIVVDGETLPVFGGYVDAPWAQHCQELEAQPNFLFEAYRGDEQIGSDRAAQREAGFTFDPARTPYLTAELGAGIQVTSHRRCYPWPIDIEAQALCMLGSGTNLLGYYMYHGGINPDGRRSTLQESRATGYTNDLPVRSYDFQTAILQSGRISPRFGRLRKLHLLVEDFGEWLAATETCFPEQRPRSPEDLETLRVSARVDPDTRMGLLFINNHQRLRTMPQREAIAVDLVWPDGGQQRIEGLWAKPATTSVIPFNLPIGDGLLISTDASLLCRLGARHVFYSDRQPRFDWQGPAGPTLTLSCDEAARAHRFAEALYIPRYDDSVLIEEEGRVSMLTTHVDEGVTRHREAGASERMAVPIEPVAVDCDWRLVEERQGEYRDYLVHIGAFAGDALQQLYLAIDYEGDRAEVYLGDKLVDDWFTTGARWYLALKRFGYPDALRLRIYDSSAPIPNPFDDCVYYDLEVTPGCALLGVEAVPEYRVELN